MSHILHHPILGLIRGRVTGEFRQFLDVPYGTIPSRFARSVTLRDSLSAPDKVYDATTAGPESIQPEKATETDASGNQFPHTGFKEAPQSEDCLFLNIKTPASASPPQQLLPVVVFLHGGAFFVGGSNRPYYDPLSFLSYGLGRDRPCVFVSINYRLGALGFLHHPDVADVLPPNNALHDQLRAFEWIGRNIEGFGGDPKRITALGQSAGAMSLALHSISGNATPLFKQMICLSGSPVTMPTKTPEQYGKTFYDLAEKLGIENPDTKSVRQVAQEFIDAPIGKLRDVGYVGAPCTSSEILPYEHATMKYTASKPASGVKWINRAIYSSASYDGGVSYNLIAKAKKGNAETFTRLVKEKMSDASGKRLLELYGIEQGMEDRLALERICRFESDIGFFWASHAQVTGSTAKKAYLQLFDLKNPFNDGGQLEKDRFATHTWDIVALLGKYDDQLPPKKLEVIREWRDRILDFICEADEPWDAWRDIGDGGKVLRVGDTAVQVDVWKDVVDEDHGRRGKLWEIAKQEKGAEGLDFLWEDICRQWLDG